MVCEISNSPSCYLEGYIMPGQAGIISGLEIKLRMSHVSKILNAGIVIINSRIHLRRIIADRMVLRVIPTIA